MDGFPSGQRGQTVNLLAPPSKVRILLHPFGEEDDFEQSARKTKVVESFSIVLAKPKWLNPSPSIDTFLLPQWRNRQTHRT